MSINEKMALMLQSKADIRQSLVNKGVDMSGVDFTGFSAKIDELSAVVECTQTEYDAMATHNAETLYIIVEE